MKKVNLRDLYPDVYKNDHFVEVTEDAVSYTHLDVYKRQVLILVQLAATGAVAFRIYNKQRKD